MDTPTRPASVKDLAIVTAPNGVDYLVVNETNSPEYRPICAIPSSLSASVAARHLLDAIRGAVQDTADLFATMPAPPDDMASLDGLTAYAEAVLEWRAKAGFPSTYDGPVGPL